MQIIRTNVKLTVHIFLYIVALFKIKYKPYGRGHFLSARNKSFRVAKLKQLRFLCHNDSSPKHPKNASSFSLINDSESFRHFTGEIMCYHLAISYIFILIQFCARFIKRVKESFMTIRKHQNDAFATTILCFTKLAL